MGQQHEWKFPELNHGRKQGVNDAGQEHFKGNKLVSLAREICQNSLDAKKRHCDGPVRVEFDLIMVAREQIPQASTLESYAISGEKYWQNVENNKATAEFFRKVSGLLSRSRIPVLRISDYGTTGITGSQSVAQSNWGALVKASGLSNKDAESGGSFGIGQNAAVACSQLRTLFYNTLDHEDIQASQGIALFPTFEDAEGVERAGVGYCGRIEKLQPLPEQISFGDFSREESGADIYVVGFDATSAEWADEMITAVLDSFFVAIHENKLVVDVGAVEISSKTIHELMTRHEGAMKLSGTKDYYSLLINPTIPWSRHEIKLEGNTLGHVKLKMSIDDGLTTRKIAQVRSTGMMIFPQGYISATKNFAGLMIAEGNELNGLLKKCENPSHNNWDSSRRKEVYGADFIIKFINSIYRDTFNSLFEEEIEDSYDAGVGRFLPACFDGLEHDKSALERTASAKIQATTLRKVQSRNPARASSDENGESEFGLLDEIEDAWTRHGSTTPTAGERPADKTSGGDVDGSGQLGRRKLALKKARVLRGNNPSGKISLILSPDESIVSATVKLKVGSESGLTSHLPIIVATHTADGSSLQIEAGNIVNLTLVKNQPIHLTAEIALHEDCVVEVDVYETL